MKQKDKRVGVFTRIYRKDETMHEAIQSVLNQTYSNLQFYIMVNEITKKSILEWKEKDSRIKIIDGDINDGFRTCAKKIASENAYVTTIDADDWYDENYLKYLVEQIENKEVDMVACGNFFFVGQNHIVGERKQVPIVWDTNKTTQVLPFIYDHFRTIWGKLIKAEVLLKSDFDALPESTKYGGYGGDTLFMFNLMLYAKRVAISDKSLYYYRMSEGSGSYSLNPGRLDSDEIVFFFVENVLKNMGAYAENQKRFLFWIYGNALIDTTKVLLYTNLSHQERAEKLLYIFQKPLSKELFIRESIGFLEISELGQNREYAPALYSLIFANLEKYEAVSQIENYYFQIFQIIFPSLKEILTEDEFRVLLKQKRLLDAFAIKNFSELTELLLVLFDTFDKVEKQNVLKITEKITSNVLMKNVLCNMNFVEKYTGLLMMISQKKYDEMFNCFHIYFSQEEMPDLAEELIDLWINLAASLENATEFVLAKQYRVEVLAKKGKIDEATKEFNDLLQLGVMDQNMVMLEEYFGFES